MAKYKVLYNPKGNNNQADAETRTLDTILKGDQLEYIDMLQVGDVKALVASIGADEGLIISGGDGTLNHFINDVDCELIGCSVYFFAAGTGNDFLKSIGEEKGKIIKINDIIRSLPTVTVNGKDYKFINGIGFGIDGYCCEVGDKMRLTSDKPINYTSIAIKGLLFHFKPVNATVTIDGKTRSYKKVWLAPTMFGGFYGGGMMPTPGQKRESGKVSTLVYHNAGKLKALMVFPSIFKGEHIEHKDMVEVYNNASEVTVEFDRPTALQIDGETVTGVLRYTVKAPK